MSDSSRFNSPSRKSRFRAQGRSRPTLYTQDPAAIEEEPAEELAATGPDDPEAEAQRLERGEGSTSEADDAEVDRAGTEEDALPAGLRLTRDPNFVPMQRGFSATFLSLLAISALLVGVAGGYFLGNMRSHGAAGALAGAKTAVEKAPVELSPEMQTAVDAAFDATKKARYDEARKRFEDLFTLHPEWPSMEIEAARAALYAHDFQGAQVLLRRAVQDRPLADAALLTALLHLTAQEYDAANGSFAVATGIDPARADIFYFWGENLRREGKPLLASRMFKAALVRNQYENVEPLYLLKYWISLVQADQEAMSGEAAKIDANLQSPHPSSAALFAGAARAVKSGDYKLAASLIGRAQPLTDPSVFNVIMRDPIFTEADLRPELAPFYR